MATQVDIERNSLPAAIGARPTVLGVGDFSPDEFREAYAAITRDADFFLAATPDSAIEHLRAAAETSDVVDPEMIVIAQAWPGEFGSAAVERLRRAAPLARVCVLLGTWSSGETRSGQPVPGALRAYWHEWAPRWQQELTRRAGSRAAGWSLPVTSTEEERLLADCRESAEPRLGLIIAVSRQLDLIAALSDACRSWGYATLALRPGLPTFRAARARGAVAVLWDAAPDEVADRRLVNSLAAQFAGAEIFALLDFPREEDFAAARSTGVTAVIGKPLRLRDLWSQIERLGGERRSLSLE
jgi:hypothetical protein